MGNLTISLFGRFDVRHDQELVEGLDGLKVQELLCYILLFRARPHQREALADVLWGADVTGDPKKYLRKTLWQLQTALAPLTAEMGISLVRTEGEWIQFDTSVSCWLDVDEFEQAFVRIRGVPSDTMSPEEVDCAQDAVALYGGHLLEGWYQDWSLYERERYAFVHLTILDKLISYYEVHGEVERAISYGIQLLKYEPTHERTHQRMMRLYHAMGNRAAALRQYDLCVKVLQQELDVSPQPSSQDLYHRIRRGERLSAVSSTEGSPEIETIYRRLQQIEGTLADAHQEVSSYIRALEPHLRSRAPRR